ncbi:lycopene cyclase domain-containing protein [Arthrobacter sp. CAN_C5]|uniref:lycopene cyclase domain-containing protein n=1 Tax=Arthrobacter sp. CAN_C5 TaxID=2760706 RepID=UPI001AE8B2A4|nr:lycopene cyclase domain-containing protein [Arthrobacter sp. CAN_C5]MBP2215271.1 lycopene cyclase domain-containing protein [Arthrobacter sp. CAN_C5]
MGLIYLGALLFSLSGMVVLDRRFGLTFWRDARKATWTMILGITFFLVWDLFGIALGIFFRGVTDLMTGILLAPELPLEEVFFLALLCYTTLNVLGAVAALDRKRDQKRDREVAA